MPQQSPLVSIITPSLNQGRFIEETILSIKNQTYPNIEHIIIDGGSTDNTLEIVKKYDGTYNMLWLSEPDEGQSDAINKGWRMSNGKIIAYLNSDDTYMPWAVETAVGWLADYTDVDMVYGNCNIIDESGKIIDQYPATDFDLREMLCGRNMIPQPAVFLRKKVIDEVGYLDTHIHRTMDYDLWLKIGLKCKVSYIRQFLASFRIYPETKGMREGYKFADDRLYALNKLFSTTNLPKEVMALRRRACSYAHLRVGTNYHSQCRMGLARKHLLRSIILYPLNLKQPFLAAYLLTSLLGSTIGTRMMKTVVDLKSRLIKIHEH